MAETVEGQVSYTEPELWSRHIGKHDVNQKEDYGWDIKRNTYKELGVWTALLSLKSSLKPLLTDFKGFYNEELAWRVSVLMMDTYLIRKSRGVDVEVPLPLVFRGSVVVACQNGVEPVMPLFNLEDFGEKADAKIDVVNDLEWIYKHIAVKNIKPEEAPSPGAFAHLQYIQQNKQNRLDFYTKVYPRLIPAKSQLEQTKFNDDNRTTFDLLNRLSTEGGGDTA